MKNLSGIKAILFICCINSVILALPPEDTLKGHIKGTLTELGPGHKIFIGTGSLHKFGNFNAEVDYYFEYATQYSGSAVTGSISNFKFSGNNELHFEINGGNWYVDFIPDPPEVIFDITAKIIGGSGVFKNASGITKGTGIQQYIPGSPTIFDFTIYVKY